MIYLVLALQAGLMLVDEFVFHYWRRLPRWERWGHPIDTLTVFVALAVPAFFSPTPSGLKLYAGLAALSCLVITKDEWVHARECVATEHWLHAVLFVLHPVVFAAIGWAWWGGFASFPRAWVIGELGVLLGFACYQGVYWIPNWKSTTASTVN